MSRGKSNEHERLAALDNLAITDTPAEAHFDAVCRLACDLFGVPIALVSLVAADRQWFKAKCGTDLSESARATSFCTHTITSDDVFVVEDAAADARFAASPLVLDESSIRFYAGAPLSLRPGIRVGALCLKDTVPRSFSSEQTRQLRDLAEIVVAHLRLHEVTRARAAESFALRVAQDAQREAESAVRASETSYRLLADNATDMVVRRSAANVRTYVSPSSLELLGFSPDEFLSIPLSQTVHPEDARASEQLMGDLLAGRIDQCRITHRNRHKDGRWIWVEANCRLVRDEFGAPVEIISTVRDITERKAAEDAMRSSEARLRLSEERLALALDSGEDCLFDWDLTDGTAWVSERWRGRLGLVGALSRPTMSDWIGAIHPDDCERVTTATRAHLRGQTPTLECEYRVGQADDEAFWVLARARVASRSPNGRALRLVGTLIDISRRKEAEARIAHMAMYDALTGLPNRNLFSERLDQALRQAALAPDRHAVLALDLDHFKTVNDTYGHPAGDRLLSLVAQRFRAAVRDQDTVARLGGDEFAVILSDIDGEMAVRQVCERILAAVDEPLLLDGVMIDIGVSIGAALVSDDAINAEGVFQRADMALFQAKAASRNSYRMYEPEAHARTATRSLLAIDMKEAIRRGDFFLVYQPIFDVTTGAIVSFEALMRWQHPVHGLISPSEFISVAEETGLITPLGTWALREACTEALNWPASMRVSVNVSAVQFRGGLEEAVVAALSATGLPAGRLKLEVTESLLMQNPEQAIAVLHRLRALGVRLALDDFGTGYSSLSYLRRFPFDKIKIDRSFIRDIADPDAAAIVRAVVSIGERMGMGIVAEGVETIEQLELVRREGCTEVQGYIFSKPRSAADARALCCERPNDERSRSDTRVRTASEMRDQPSFPDEHLPSSGEGNLGFSESKQSAEISGEPRFVEPIVDRAQETLRLRRKTYRC